MENKNKIIKAVYSAVDEVNRMLPKEMRLDKALDVDIMGDGGTLDSLGLINLIVATEAKIAEEFGVTIALVDSMTVFTKEDSPLLTIESLVEYITLLLKEETHGQDRI